jgi:periplasmic divalent cation tolerance protein
MPSRTPHLLRAILVTTSGDEQARSIARILVGERLAACVNIIGPIRSVYRWREAVEDEPEYLLLIKTRATLYNKVERRVLELHTYEVPEVLALKIDRGSPTYVKWLLESTGQGIPSETKSRKAGTGRTKTRNSSKSK